MSAPKRDKLYLKMRENTKQKVETVHTAKPEFTPSHTRTPPVSNPWADSNTRPAFPGGQKGLLNGSQKSMCWNVDKGSESAMGGSCGAWVTKRHSLEAPALITN